jgi:tRNA1Val (adenine37-N6)-methyltransferase
MANNYFKFKQFTIWQDKCAMKVSTTACILGAYTNVEGNTVLDIGTGTGLLSLMLAQKYKQAQITSIDIDEQAIAQAKYNIANSNFSNQIKVEHCAIQQFKSEFTFDTIICNPPFFENSLPSNSLSKNVAWHNTSLGLQVLLKHIHNLLNPNASAYLLLSYAYYNQVQTYCAQANLYLQKVVFIKHTKEHSIDTFILIITKQKVLLLQEELCIKNKDGSYTEEFTALMQPYYLFL